MQLSVAVANPVCAGSDESEQLISTFFGQVISGSVSSMIQICCTHVLTLPQRSVAVQVLLRIPVPLQPNKRDSSSLYSITIEAWGVQLSDAVASPVKSGETEDSQLIVAGGGQVSVGFSKSVM